MRQTQKKQLSQRVEALLTKGFDHVMSCGGTHDITRDQQFSRSRFLKPMSSLAVWECDEEISDDEKSDSDVAIVAAPTALQRVTSFNLRPSLEDLHYPGWTIEIVAGQVMMKEVEKNRVYFVPASRFNKAAELLLQENVIRDWRRPSGARLTAAATEAVRRV